MSIENNQATQKGHTAVDVETSDTTDAEDIDSASWTVFERTRETLLVQGDRRKRAAAIPVSFVSQGIMMGMDLKSIRKSAEEKGIAFVQPKNKTKAA